MSDVRYVDRAVVIGPACGGKGTVARILSERTGYKTFSRYQVVRDYATSLGIENPNWEQLWDLDQELMRKNPLRVIEDVMNQAGKTRSIIDGLRHPHEIKYLKADPTLTTLVIFVDVSGDPQKSADLRWRRMRNRARPDSPKIRREFDKNEGIGWGLRRPPYPYVNLSEAAQHAEVIIINSGREVDLQQDVEDVLDRYTFR